MKHKKVLVTGTPGFIASHLADTIEAIGYHALLGRLLLFMNRSQTLISYRFSDRLNTLFISCPL
jgi:hypothetical protein|tara:strand:- start:202 stop:393 length:192 start_codon:yes stop_codon:yes gene_type:complete